MTLIDTGVLVNEFMTLPPQRYPIPRRGHFALPGSGPAGETCGSCVLAERVAYAGGKRHLKCLKRRAAWTRTTATDIARADPACHGWEGSMKRVVKVLRAFNPPDGPFRIHDRDHLHDEVRTRLSQRDAAKMQGLDCAYFDAAYMQGHWKLGDRVVSQRW